VAEATLGTARETLQLHETEMLARRADRRRRRHDPLAADHPDTDTQQLRSLVRAARRDAAGLAPRRASRKSFRELFQFIKPMLVETKT
jgi:ribosome-associated protein